MNKSKGYKDENATQVHLTERPDLSRAAQATRERALLGDLENQDAKDRAKRPASRATKAKESKTGNDDRKCSK